MSFSSIRYSVSNDDNDNDYDYNVKTSKSPPKRRKRKPPPQPLKVNHDLSENSDDDLIYSRRSINVKPKRHQETSSSSSILSSDGSHSRKRARRPPTPTFKRAQAERNKKKKIIETSEDEIISDRDNNTDVEKMDDQTLIKKAERRMLNDEDLTQLTKKALEDERQRAQRIQERQSQLPPLSQIVIDDDTFSFDTKNKKKDEDKEAKLVFEYEPNTGKSLIWVLPELVTKMKPHQLDGTMFLWDNIYESIAQIKKGSEGTGCILAHHMGL